jgi:hypothetical protein
MRRFALVLFLIVAAALTGLSAYRWNRNRYTPGDATQVMSWLPADTETVTVARGPFVFPSMVFENEAKDRAISDKELAQDFEELPLTLLRLKNGLLSKHLQGKSIALAVEGARHFRSPAGLGMMPYEGCSIAVFSDSLRDEFSSFIQDARNSMLRSERIEKDDISVFQEKLEKDMWTTFVAFPEENVVLVCSDRNYLAEVLARLHGQPGQRALPSNLPEWKYVDSYARFWGVRHYDRSQSEDDPSSPFGGRKSANFPDEQAVGVTFVFDPQKGRSALVTYLSGDPGIASKPTNSPMAMAGAPEAKGLNIKCRELSPGVLEGAYTLEHLYPEKFFFFVLEGVLGRAIYL